MIEDGVRTMDEFNMEAKQEGANIPVNQAPSDRAEPSNSPGVSIGNFDILVSLGEVEQFALAVKAYADLIPDPRWRVISRAMEVVITEHEHFNEVSKR